MVAHTYSFSTQKAEVGWFELRSAWDTQRVSGQLKFQTPLEKKIHIVIRKGERDWTGSYILSYDRPFCCCCACEENSSLRHSPADGVAFRDPQTYLCFSL